MRNQSVISLPLYFLCVLNLLECQADIAVLRALLESAAAVSTDPKAAAPSQQEPKATI
jgi:hypothetical protein